MADQLSLRLEADQLPDLPDLRPMLPRVLPAPFDSDEHLFEPWWGGERALAMIGPAELAGTGAVRIVDADGRDLTSVLPELAGLAVRVAARSAILDGELVVVDGSGRADSGELERRLSGEAGRSAAFLAFDLLHLDGRSLMAMPAIATEGIALHAAVEAQGIAGVLARHRSSPYLAGVRSRLWRFVAAGAGGAEPAETDVAGAGQSSGAEPGLAAAASAPVLALISRLPLEDH
jgi:bifunctional non-homologous end joining protein LigD